VTAAVARPRYRLTYAVLAGGVASYALMQSLVVPVLSTLQAELHTTQNTITWVLTANLLSTAIFTPIMGRIGDLVGKERMFVVALVALAAGSLLGALAPNVQVMIAARAIQGIGGGVVPLAFGIIRDELPKEKVTSAVGAVSSLTAVGAGAGIVLAGPIVESLDYHWLFWLPMIMTGAAAIAAHFFVPESPVRSSGRISWLPAVLLSAWLVALLVAVSEGSDWGWVSGRTLGLLGLAVVLALAWVASEQRALTPMIDLTMMRRRAVWTNNLVALLIGSGMYGTFGFLPELVQTPRSSGYGFGSSITESGLFLLPSTITMFGVGIYAGRFAARVGGKVVVILGCLVATVAMELIAFGHGEKWELYAATAIMGAGFGLAFAAMSGLIVGAVPPEQTGVASGMNANIRTIGGSIGAAVLGSIVTSRVASDGLPEEAGYTIGFALLGAATLIAAGAALLIPAARAGRVIDPVDEPEHAAMALVAGATLIGDKPE
jgi:EmrB/QacA subfamily drug resistance transporter